MRPILIALLLSTSAAVAENATLNFDTAKLCQWQFDNNSMDVTECTKLEVEAEAIIADLESKSDAKRKEDCATEGKNVAVDSGYASYYLYASCLKDGPGNL